MLTEIKRTGSEKGIFMGRPRIYIVDDDKACCTSIKEFLISAGYPSESFSSARSFLDSVPNDSKGFLLLDLHMPEMDGFALQERLNELRSPLRIIFISGDNDSKDRMRATQKGAVGFLQKPFDVEEFLDLINETAEKDQTG